MGVRQLVHTSITPNQITTLRLTTGVGAAMMYSIGLEFWTYVGSVVFVISIFLDRADGILARLRGSTSLWGHNYDLISDSISNSLTLIGIGIGLRNSALDIWAIPIGFIAGISISAVLWLVMRAESENGIRAVELEGRAGFDPDDAMVLVPLAMVLGWGTYLIIAAAIGSTLFTIVFFWKFREFLFRK